MQDPVELFSPRLLPFPRPSQDPALSKAYSTSHAPVSSQALVPSRLLHHPRLLPIPVPCRAVPSHSQTSSPSQGFFILSGSCILPGSCTFPVSCTFQTHSLSLVPAPCHYHVPLKLVLSPSSIPSDCQLDKLPRHCLALSGSLPRIKHLFI